MKPPPFAYDDPATLDEALALLAEPGARPLAGGQSLVPLLNARAVRPTRLVDLRRLDGLRSVHVGADAVTVGALTTARALLGDDDVRQALPGLADAVARIGHTAIRTRTTVGGSLAHADPAGELPAVLLGLDGSVDVASAAGTRTIRAADLYRDGRTAACRPDELIVAARFPRVRGTSAWDEQPRRPGGFALVGAFVAVDDGRTTVALAGVADRPVRARSCEAILARDRSLSDATIAGALDALRAELDPPGDQHATGDHRRALAATLVERLLRRCRR